MAYIVVRLHWLPRFDSPHLVEAQFTALRLRLHRLGCRENVGGVEAEKRYAISADAFFYF